MMWRSFSLLAFLCLGICAADELSDKVNAYIDDFITKATNESGGFIDPLELEEVSQGFEREVGFVKVKGQARLYDGRIEGLSTLQRKGKAVAIDLDDVYIFSCQLSFKKLKAFYRGSLTINDIGPRITMNARVGYSEVSMFLTVPAEGGNTTLLSLNINKISNVRISVWGLGPWGWAASMVSSMALNALEKPVAKAASIKLFDYFSKEMEKYPFPG